MEIEEWKESDFFLGNQHVSSDDASAQDPMRSLSNDANPLPEFSEAALLNTGAHLSHEQIISLSFLLVTKPDVAHKKCLEYEFARRKSERESLGRNFVNIFISFAKKNNWKQGWHMNLLIALRLIDRLKLYMNQLLASEKPLVVKLHEYQSTADWLFNKRFEIDEYRVRLFLLCEQLGPKDASLLIKCIKDNCNPETLTEQDAVPWPCPRDKISENQLETNLLELLKNNDPKDLLSKIKTVFPAIVKFPGNETKYQQTFNLIFGRGKEDDSQPSSEKTNRSGNQLKKGLGLVINNQEFKINLSTRDGSEQDERELIRVWKKFNCEITPKRNLTAQGMKDALKEFREKVGKHESDGFFIVIAILSHGRNVAGRDEIMGVDGKPVATDFITDMFTNVLEHPEMDGKVKLFLIQACRNKESQDPPEESDSTLPPTSSTDEIQTDSGSVERAQGPNRAMTIVFNSTVPGEYSFRSRTKGTFFIQAFCKELEENGDKLEISHIFTKANGEMNKELAKNSTQKQCGILSSTMGEFYYLPSPNER